MAKASDRKLLKTMRDRYERCVETDTTNRQLALEDMRFIYIPGEQWTQEMKAQRKGRPCLEFNRLRVTAKRIINQMRAQRPSGKVRAAEDADKQTSEAMEGLIRNIWTTSDGDSVIDQAAEYQVGAGMGAWRINTRYSRDDAWDQDIVVEAIPNPLCLHCDPAAQDPIGSDAEYWILSTRISRTSYQARWPNAKVVEWDGVEFDSQGDWSDEDSVRIAEYWHREPVADTLVLLSDGKSVRKSALTPEVMAQQAALGITVVREREVQTYAIKMCIASGDAILESSDWAGTKFPFVRIYGERMVIDGKIHWWGIGRHGKDAQKAYNYSRTAQIETVATAPQSKFWVTPEQAHGLEATWAQAHQQNLPYLLYNPDPKAPGSPARMAPPDVPAALVQQSLMDAEDIKSVTGVFDPSLGAKTNAVSGVAKRAEIQQGEVATFNYSDNLTKGIRRTWELLVDLIPHVYDTQRNLRVLGADGAEQYLAINDGAVDLSRGQYDVVVTVGPNYATQRQEAAELYTSLAQSNPAIGAVASDLIVKTFDLPYSDEIAERIQTILPPEVKQMLAAKEQQGGKLDPQVMQAMAQADQAMQLVQQQAQLVTQAAGEADEKTAEAEKAVAQLQVQQANFEAQVSKQLADITRREAQLMLKQAQAGVDAGGQAVTADREALSGQVTSALATIQQQAAEFMVAASQALAEIQSKQAPVVVVADPPKQKVVRVRRVNGELVGEIQEVA